MFSGAGAQLNYTLDYFTGSYTPITSGGGGAITVGLPGDGVYTNALPIGFSFNYNGTGYTSFGVSTDGFMSFTATANSAADQNLVTTSAPNAALAPWWDDLTTTAVGTNPAGGILYQTMGTPGSRVLTVQWVNNSCFGGSGATQPKQINYQVKLYETTNVIEFWYGAAIGSTYNPQESAAIGIKSQTGGDGQFICAVTGSNRVANRMMNSSKWPVVNARFTPGAPPPLAGGTYTVGSGGQYPNLSSALKDLNNRGIAGAVTLNLTDAVADDSGPGGKNTFPLILGPVVGTSSINTISITSSVGTVLTYAGSPAGNVSTTTSLNVLSNTNEGLLDLVGTDHVTVKNLNFVAVNSVNPARNVDRGMLLCNMSGTDGATNNLVHNCTFNMDRTNTSTIAIHQMNLVSPTAAIGANSNNTYRNFTIRNSNRGVYLQGNATWPDVNDQITTTASGIRNSIGDPNIPGDIGNTSAAPYGVRIDNGSNFVMRNCDIRNVVNTGGQADGINVSFQGSCEISNNTINGVRNGGATSTSPITGIRAIHLTASGHTLRLYNNAISNISSGYTGSATSTRVISGIYMAASISGATYEVDFNSVSIDGSTSPNCSNVCMEWLASGTINNYRNNILANFTGAQSGTAKHYVVRCPSTSSMGAASSVCDRNIYHLANTGNGFIGLTSTTDRATLGNWQAALTGNPGVDANTLTVNPGFANNQTDLHIDLVQSGAIDLDGTGIAVAGITGDIDGDPRSTPPDRGCDEFSATNCTTANGYQISGPSTICNGSASLLTLTPVPTLAGLSQQWSYGPLGNPTLNSLGASYEQSLTSIPAGTWQVVCAVTCANCGPCSTTTPEFGLQVNALPAGIATGPAAGETYQNLTYTISGAPPGATFQWQYATSMAGPYSNLANGTGSSVTTIGITSGTIHVRCVVTSAGTGCISTSNVVSTTIYVDGNYACEGIPITVGTNGPFTNVGATLETGEPTPPTDGCTGQTSWCNAANNTVWFTFTAPPSGRVSLNFGSTANWDSQIALWSAPSCYLLLNGAATLLAANDDITGSTPYHAAISPICVIPGATYFVQVDGYDATTNSAFELVLVEEPAQGVTASISANPTSICWGSSSTVTITGTVAATVTYRKNGGAVQNGVLTNGTLNLSTGTLYTNTTYELLSATNGVCTQTFTNQSVTIQVDVTDWDGDGTPNCADNCPLVAGQIGSACNDGNAETINDVLNSQCNCVGTPVVRDLRAYIWTLPVSSCILDGTELVRFTIWNSGNVPATGYTTGVIVNNDTVQVVSGISTVINAGTTVQYTFPQTIDLAATGAYEIKVFVQLPNDVNNANNMLVQTVTHYADVDPAGQINGRIPYDGTIGVTWPVNYSWQPVANATRYDLYVWRTVDPMPVSPTVNNIAGINYTHGLTLQYATQYNWKVVAENTCAPALVSSIYSFTTALQPDLTVQSIQVPGSPFSGQSIQLSWQVRNLGPNATGTLTWYDRVYLSTDNILDVADTYVGQALNPLTLGVNDVYTSSVNTTIPITTFGTWYVIVKTDYFSGISEANENNNTLAQVMPISQTAPPDLQVTNLVGPSNAISELSYPVNWTVTNAGTGATTEGTWLDRLYISSQSIFNINQAQVVASVYRNNNLAAGGSYVANTNITIPQGYNGTYYLHVRTDLNAQVYEFTNENNNTSGPFQVDVVLQPPPDLTVQIQSVTPLLADNRGTLTVQYRVQNIGAPFTSTNVTDRLYLGTNSVFNNGTTYYLGSTSGNIALANSGMVDRQVTGTVPSAITGNYFVFVFTDYNDDLYEYTFEANNSTMFTGLQVRNPDLQATALTGPSSAGAGQSIALTWSVNNLGPGNLVNATRSDRIYLNTTPTTSGAAVLGTFSYSDSHEAGTTKSRSGNVTLPTGIVGNYHLLVQTDATSAIFENGLESNNTTSIPILVNTTPSPDLSVSAITGLPSTITAGQSVTVSYTVSNTSTATLSGSSWTDRIHVSGSALGQSADAVQVGTVGVSELLATGGSYTRSVTFTMPILLSTPTPGSYYVRVVADAFGQVFEGGAEANNALSSAGVAVQSPPPVELQVLTAQLNTTTVVAGTAYPLSYSVLNNGTSTATWNIGSWSDAVYLSLDTIWQPSDVVLTSTTISGGVGSGQTYTRTLSVTIPYGVNGQFYLLLKADRNVQTNDPIAANNVRKILLTGQTPGSPGGGVVTLPNLSYPDFDITAFNVPSQGTAGQPVTITWSVANIGDSTAHGTSVLDRAYLSTDQTISTNDVVLGSLSADLIAPSGSYSRTLNATLPLSAGGNYYVLIKTDALDAEYESGTEGNNTVSSVMLVIQSQPGDLVVTDVVPPATAVVGQTISITYRVQNNGANPVVGGMRDVVFLSLDDIWDVSDVPVIQYQRSVSLAPGTGAWSTVNATLPGVAAGTYYAIVQTDALNNFSESVETNNRGASVNTVDVGMPLLVLDVVESFQLPITAERFYRIHIPDSLAGETMLVTLSSSTPTGANELYTSFATTPTRSDHDYAATEPNSPNQQLIVPVLEAGDYYVLAYGTTPNNSLQNAQLLATILPFEVISIAANTGGNTGNCTVEIEGAKFTMATSFSLIGPGGTISASSTTFIHSSRVFATFPLAGASLGTYDVLATNPNAEIADLPDGFTVVQGTGVGGGFGSPGSSGNGPIGGFNCSITSNGAEQELATLLDHPPNVRRNSPVPITVQWSYNGNVDIPIQSRLVISLNGLPLGFNNTDLALNNTELVLEFTETGGPPGIIRPGATGSISLLSRATTTDTELQFIIVN